MERKKIQINRSEEVQDIVDRMPVKGPRFVLYIVAGLATMLLIFGYFIKYPEVVTGTVTITMGKAPLKLVAKSSGRLLLLGNQPRQDVYKGDIIGLIDNATNFRDYLLIDSILRKFSISEQDSVKYNFPDNLNLGELNSTYYQFLDAWKEYIDFQEHDIYELKEDAVRIQITSCKESLKSMELQLVLKKEQLEYYRREVSRDSFCLVLGDHSERALDRTRNTYNTMLETYTNLLSTIKQQKIRLKELENQLQQLRREHHDHEGQVKMNIRSAYNNLEASMKQWQDRYAFVAPFAGRIEFLSFWRENDFVTSGSDIFSIVPDQSPVVGHLLLPSVGAGKVKTGQEVSIKLNDFPYLEYGLIEGNVSSISLVANQVQLSAQAVDMYLVTISLPDGLRTKFGSVLEFRYEIKGSADIRTEKRRLIQRLFDNLKYSVN